MSGPIIAGDIDGESLRIPDSFYYVTHEHAELFDPELFFKLFDAGEFPVAQNQETKFLLPYRLFKPTFADTVEKFPLIVWLHGYGGHEATMPNIGQLKHLQLVFRDLEHPEEYRFFLLAPQNAASRLWFSQAGESENQTDIGEGVLSLIDDSIAKYPIDPNRITLVGISSGATASWEFAKRRPGLFAAVMLFGSGGCTLDRFDELVSVPIWAFHAEEDFPEGDRRAIAHLKSLGGCGYLTQAPGKEHCCWYWGFCTYDLLSWLLAQRKDCPCSPPPGPTPTQRITAFAQSYWPQSAGVALIVACFVLVLSRRKHRLLTVGCQLTQQIDN